MTREEFFTKLENGTTWSAGVAFKRANPLPLDKYAVFNTEEALNAYISGPVAYPGHVVALVGADATTIYYLDYKHEAETEEEKSQLIAREVGKIPVGDGKTVEVAADGTISLAGLTDLEYERTDAESGEVQKIKYQPVLDENGITWVERSTITVEALDLRLKNVESATSDLADALGTAADGEIEATGLYKELADVSKIANEAKESANEAAAELISVNAKVNEADRIARDAQNKIDTFMDENAATDETINTLKEVIALIEAGDEVAIGLLSEVAKLKEKDISLEELISNKVDKKKTIYNGIETDWTLLSPENQAKLAALILEDGNIEISGKVNVENVEGLPSVLNEKVNEISISNGNIEYETSDPNAAGFISKTAKITLGVATDSLAGAVKGITLDPEGSNAAAAMNKIAVASDGTMEVNTLNVNKLVQDESSVLVLYGGSATDNI